MSPDLPHPSIRLPADCEPLLLERFLKAEAMALWAVRSAQLQDVPANVRIFLRKHEEDERDHLRQFESLLGRRSHGRERLPAVPRQWPTLAVQLYGYESLGLEFAALLATMRPDLASILEDEEAHVGFFERELRKILDGDAGQAELARMSARAWRRKLPATLDRYLDGQAMRPFKEDLARGILSAIDGRFVGAGLLDPFDKLVLSDAEGRRADGNG
jgi:hypothetical protein